MSLRVVNLAKFAWGQSHVRLEGGGEMAMAGKSCFEGDGGDVSGAVH
jgi:hypothetical protein